MFFTEYKLCNYLFAFLIIFLATAPFITFAAEEDPFSTSYFPHFKEGTSITATMGELDILIFSYYNKNYTMRVLGVNFNSSDIRVEKKGVEILFGETAYFNIDNVTDIDINISLVDIDSKEATFTMSLNKRPEARPVQNTTNTTNTSASNTTSQSNSTANRTSNSSSANSSSTSSSSQASNTSSSAPRFTATNASQENITAPVGGTVYNIDININLPPGSGIGLLIIVSIVLFGLVAYKKIKRRVAKGGEGLVLERKLKPSQPSKPHTSFKTKFKRSITKIRKKLAEKIAGKEFVRKNY